MRAQPAATTGVKEPRSARAREKGSGSQCECCQQQGELNTRWRAATSRLRLGRLSSRRHDGIRDGSPLQRSPTRVDPASSALGPARSRNNACPANSPCLLPLPCNWLRRHCQVDRFIPGATAHFGRLAAQSDRSVDTVIVVLISRRVAAALLSLPLCIAPQRASSFAYFVLPSWMG
jgi:hypothetical protein